MPLKVCYFSDGNNSIHDVRFLTSLNKKGYDAYAVYLCRVSGRHVEGIKELFLGYEKYRGKGRLYKMIGIIQSLKKLKRFLNEIEPDVLHAGWVPTCGLLSALSHYHPFLLMPWGSDVLLIPERNLLYKKIVRYAIKRADMITCDCETVKQKIVQLTRYPEEKIIVFPWGINLSLFYPDEGKREQMRDKLGCKDKKVIIMNRSFKPVYGIEYFLRALPRVFQEIPEAYVLLLGSGELEPQLRLLTKQMGIEGKVQFLGEVDNEEMPYYLNASDLYVSSSLSDGTSLSLLEAMACALPVVVTDVPAILEWVKQGKNGIVVSRRSVDELAEAIIHLLKNEDAAKEMGRRNREIAQEKADWEKNFAKLEEIYKNLCPSTSV